MIDPTLKLVDSQPRSKKRLLPRPRTMAQGVKA